MCRTSARISLFSVFSSLLRGFPLQHRPGKLADRLYPVLEGNRVCRCSCLRPTIWVQSLDLKELFAGLLASQPILGVEKDTERGRHNARGVDSCGQARLPGAEGTKFRASCGQVSGSLGSRYEKPQAAKSAICYVILVAPCRTQRKGEPFRTSSGKAVLKLAFRGSRQKLTSFCRESRKAARVWS